MQQTAQFSKSKVQCLVRHRGGNYYAPAKVAGKVIRRSLETDDSNTAKNRLPGVLAEMRGARNASLAGTLGQAITDEAQRVDPSFKATTRHYDQQIAVSLAKTATASATRDNGALALLRRTYDRAVESRHVAANLAHRLKRIRPKTLGQRVADSFAELAEKVGKERTWVYRQVKAGSVKLITGYGAAMIPTSEITII